MIKIVLFIDWIIYYYKLWHYQPQIFQGAIYEITRRNELPVSIKKKISLLQVFVPKIFVLFISYLDNENL